MNSETKVYSVTEVNSLIGSVVETGIPPLWVEGEISGWTRAASGHVYFTLKDESSQIPCVMWRQQAGSLLFMPTDGMQVRISGKITVYQRGGKYQLAATRLYPVGVGDMYLKFEELKKRLAEEGIFDDARKMPLPLYPETVGIVTSKDAAALTDIIKVLGKRAPYISLKLSHTRVQGEGAAGEIASAIGLMDEIGGVDVMILARGGGSIEDLWAFNEEEVVRAIVRSKTPVVCAVGHEVDYTISDFAADSRAPTPSAAAEMIVRDKEDLLDLIGGYLGFIDERVGAVLRESERTVDELGKRLELSSPERILVTELHKLQETSRLLEGLSTRVLEVSHLKFRSVEGKLKALNPDSVLARGYSIVYRMPAYEVVSESKQVKKGNAINIKLNRGSLEGTITEVHNGF